MISFSRSLLFLSKYLSCIRFNLSLGILAILFLILAPELQLIIRLNFRCISRYFFFKFLFCDVCNVFGAKVNILKFKILITTHQHLFIFHLFGIKSSRCPCSKFVKTLYLIWCFFFGVEMPCGYGVTLCYHFKF